MSSPQSKARVIGLMRPLKDVTVTAGETATFECELSYEGIAVEWLLGGTKLEPSDRVSPNTLTFSILTLLSSGSRCSELWRVLLSFSQRSSDFAQQSCSMFSYKVLLVEVQDSSRGFDPSFEITQAGKLSAPQAFLWGYFYQLREVLGVWQVATAASRQLQKHLGRFLLTLAGLSFQY